MNKVESGAVFKFDIPFDMGVGYCQIVNFQDVSFYYGITVKVFDYFESDIPDLELFNNIPLFMNPLPVIKMPTIKGKFAWKRLGVINTTTCNDIPHYKEYVKEGFAWNTLKEYEEKDWNVLINLKERIKSPGFNSVRHLEELFWRSTTTIEKRVAMTLLRYKKINVQRFFEENQKGDSWIIDYNTQKFIPLYKNIPEPIRGKPLINGFVPDEYLNFDWNTIMD